MQENGNMSKFKNGSSRRLLNELEREGEYFGNDVVKEKKGDNLCFKRNQKIPIEHIKVATDGYMSSLSYRKMQHERVTGKGLRKDGVEMMQLVSSVPKGTAEEFYQDYMNEFTEFLSSHGFHKSVTGSAFMVVHRDENIHSKEPTEHFHIAFMPINEDEKFSAKTLFTRQFTTEFQEFNSQMLQKHNIAVEPRDKKSTRRHRNVKEYKDFVNREKAIQEQETRYEKLIQEANTLKSDANTLLSDVQRRERDVALREEKVEETAKTLYVRANAQGYEKGEKEGYDSGYAKGYSDAFEKGEVEGFRKGYEKGEEQHKKDLETKAKQRQTRGSSIISQGETMQKQLESNDSIDVDFNSLRR